jgi:hypothetical protein
VSAANAKAILHRGRINGDALPSALLVGKVEERVLTALPVARLESRLQAVQKRNGLTETDIAPSVVCSTLNSISFCAVVSTTVTDNNPLQVTARVALFLDLKPIVSPRV